MTEIIAESRYYAIHRLLNTSKPFATDDQAALLLSERMTTEIDKAMESVKEMIAETGGSIDGYEINTKPFGVETLAFVLIEIVVYVRRNFGIKTKQPLSAYKYQNLYEAHALGLIDFTGDEFHYDGSTCQPIIEHLEGGDDDREILLVDIGGVWYVLDDETKQEIENEQE